MMFKLLTPLQDPGTAWEAFGLAAREAAAHGLDAFVGGATVIITAPVLVLILILI